MGVTGPGRFPILARSAAAEIPEFLGKSGKKLRFAPAAVNGACVAEAGVGGRTSVDTQVASGVQPTVPGVLNAKPKNAATARNANATR